MGKKPIVSVTYENERISIKNSLPYIKCVLRLSCVVHGPIYGLYCKRSSLFITFMYREKIVYSTVHKTAINRPMDHTEET